MSARLLPLEENELGSRFSLSSEGGFDLDEADPEVEFHHSLVSFIKSSLSLLISGLSYRTTPLSRPVLNRYSQCRRRYRRTSFLIRVALGILLIHILLTAMFWPSYTHPPPCYETLRRMASSSNIHGRGNPRNEKVYIASALYDPTGELSRGQWGQAVLHLIELLGEDNVYLSIYENNSGEAGERALRDLANRVTCDNSIVSEKHLNLDSFPRVTIPSGEKRVKRIDYLAEIRNRALHPLDQQPDVKYDKLLYLNDAFFNPVEALQLLFCTNAGGNGMAQYRAACAVDFSNAFKFYDSYATRDLQGYGIGLPFFPWFTTAGNGQSREDVLAGRDAVRVRSCWGGMVAFDAKYFQGSNAVRFRAHQGLFWDASECCIIHADIQDAPSNVDDITDTGIYMNPFIRVAYDGTSLSWLWTTRRFEKLYSFVHKILNHLVGFPESDPWRIEVPGQKVQREVWVPDDQSERGGRFQIVDVIVGNDGFCGRRGLEVVLEDRKWGQDGFETIPVPGS